MTSQEIEQYLAELGAELKGQGIKKPIRIMIIGGAYMLLIANSTRPTEDVDFFWLEKDVFQPTFSQQTFDTFTECVQTVTERHQLETGWFNYFAQMLMIDDVLVPDGKVWKRLGPLHVYVPPKEYILALKIIAGRSKDLDDCAILLPQTRVKTRQQAQQLIDRYILPEAQQKHAEQIEDSLNTLFPNETERRE